MSEYFVIRNSDGDTIVEKMNRETLLTRLDPSDPYYGASTGFVSEIKDKDTNYWGNNLLIIKGEIVTPSPVKVVEKVDIA